MKSKSINNIIATRKLSASDGAKITISIGKPEKHPNHDDYCCPYRIEGLGKNEVMEAFGVDEIQAILLALTNIGSMIATSTQYKSRALKWIDGSTLSEIGFPIPDSIKNLQFDREQPSRSKNMVDALLIGPAMVIGYGILLIVTLSLLSGVTVFIAETVLHPSVYDIAIYFFGIWAIGFILFSKKTRKYWREFRDQLKRNF